MRAPDHEVYVVIVERQDRGDGPDILGVFEDAGKADRLLAIAKQIDDRTEVQVLSADYWAA